MKKKELALLIIVSLVLIIAAAVFALSFWDPSVAVLRCEVLVPEVNEKLYFRSEAWGFGGGHWQVILSADRRLLGKRRDYDKETEYLFYEPDGVLYRVRGKTLEIHVHWYDGPKPKQFSSQADIKIITYDHNPDWQELLGNYKKRGLTEVSDCAKDQGR